MSTPHDDFDVIAAYREDTLTPKEKAAFVARLAKDNQLQIQLDLYDNLTDFLVTEEIARTKTLTNTLIAQKHAKGKKRVWLTYLLNYKKRVVAVAAIILVFIGLFWWYYPASQRNADLAQHYFSASQTLSYHPNTMSSNVLDINEKKLLEAHELYEKKVYVEALNILKNYSLTTDAAILLTGVCEYELQNYSAAITSFLSLSNNPNSDRVGLARWYLALTYIATNNTTAAIPLLQTIIKDKSAYYEQARALLAKLKT